MRVTIVCTKAFPAEELAFLSIGADTAGTLAHIAALTRVDTLVPVRAAYLIGHTARSAGLAAMPESRPLPIRTAL